NAMASQANQRGMLPGGRPAMMGGAYTAVADDSTGSYYNPAGLSFTKDPRLEVSATAYSKSTVVYDDTVNEEPFSETSESIYPSFIGATARFDWLTIGYSFLTLDSRNVYQQNGYDDISSIGGAPHSYSRTYQ